MIGYALANAVFPASWHFYDASIREAVHRVALLYCGRIIPQKLRYLAGAGFRGPLACLVDRKCCKAERRGEQEGLAECREFGRPVGGGCVRDRSLVVGRGDWFVRSHGRRWSPSQTMTTLVASV